MKNTKKILSWNVNGIRAINKKGFVPWFNKEKPDILCLQETKAEESQVPEEITSLKGYHQYYCSAVKKGYSGTALFSKTEPEHVDYGFGIDRFDSEGRTIIAHYDSFVLFNIYYPNGQMSDERLQYKMDFYDAFLEYADSLKDNGKNLIICGDVNTAHTEIDLARPKANEDSSGFLPQERAWIDKFISHGYVDTFRLFTAEGSHYSWWSYRANARANNAGWRIDYFFVSDSLKGDVKSSFMLTDVMGSDHCPIGIEIKNR
ncbi:MAG: exodeoxyribonuclease III [bacterium]|nr:exodeoxyribonuclease III [bacterium]